MKRSVTMVFVVILMLTLTACRQDTGRAIDQRYRDLKSYTTQMHVTVTGNKGKSEYQLAQVFLAPNQCRTEVLAPEEWKGTISIVSGEDMHLIGGNAPAVSLKQNRMDAVDYLSVAEFFHTYFADGQMEQTDGMVVLRTVTEEETPYRASQMLQLDAKTLLPMAMVVFDHHGNEIIRANYKNFVLDARIEKGAFAP